jgi:hypothetical protein
MPAERYRRTIYNKNYVEIGNNHNRSFIACKNRKEITSRVSSSIPTLYSICLLGSVENIFCFTIPSRW